MKAIMEVLNSLFVWEQETKEITVSNEEIASNDMYYYA